MFSHAEHRLGSRSRWCHFWRYRLTPSKSLITSRQRHPAAKNPTTARWITVVTKSLREKTNWRRGKERGRWRRRRRRKMKKGRDRKGNEKEKEEVEEGKEKEEE